MKLKLSMGFALMTLLFTAILYAGTNSVWNTQNRIFNNTNCQENNSCDLKNFSLLSEDYKVVVGDVSVYGTRMIAQYETSSVDTLTNYGLVQFIRGCVFYSTQMGRKYFFYKLHFGEHVAFYFPQWVIDSADRDPMFYPSVGENRHYLYYWGPRPEFNQSLDDEKILGKKLPDHPSLWVIDRPARAFFERDLASNVSLQFKTCIYKTTDVPRSTTQDNTNFAEPLHCFSWQSSFIYNFDLAKFETKKELDPFCLKEEEK